MKLTTPRKCGDATVTGYKSSVISKAETDRAQRLVTAIANTAAIDMDDEVVVPSGAAERSYFDVAKTIYLNHDYTIPIGRMRWRKLKDGAHLVQFHVSDKTTVARDAFELIDEGIIAGVSIGFEATDRSEPTDEETDLYGPASVVTRAWNWIELSATSMPCNSEALVQAVERGDASLDDAKATQVDALVKKGMVSRETARIIGLPDRKVFAVSPTRVLKLDPPRVLKLDSP